MLLYRQGKLRIVGAERPMISIPPELGAITGRLLGYCMDDVIITPEEIQGLMADLLYVESPPAGRTRLTEWAREHRNQLGRRYTSELARRRDRRKAYRSN